MKAASAPVDPMSTDPLKTKRTLAVTLGSSLREARLNAGLTQADVASNVGIVTEVYGRIERGQLLPSLPKLRKLCVFLQVDANAALKIDGHPPPQWPEASSGPDLDDSPRLRRLHRALRTLDEEQLAALNVMVRLLAKRSHPRKPDAKEEEPPGSLRG
ncbi:helix-turn-helix transcriptional regulator [Archangium sp.]|uniref:helix-turn-helix transcriptional regulator n=1 Tax=Archangium sp. TaxID=1872627 RepID=UPI00286D1B9E|nr:helix-turn-helix transcriptional regulator [Archangium sp.]